MENPKMFGSLRNCRFNFEPNFKSLLCRSWGHLSHAIKTYSGNPNEFDVWKLGRKISHFDAGTKSLCTCPKNLMALILCRHFSALSTNTHHMMALLWFITDPLRLSYSLIPFFYRRLSIAGRQFFDSLQMVQTVFFQVSFSFPSVARRLFSFFLQLA